MTIRTYNLALASIYNDANAERKINHLFNDAESIQQEVENEYQSLLDLDDHSQLYFTAVHTFFFVKFNEYVILINFLPGYINSWAGIKKG